jgi:hypothetical protein
MKWLGIMFLVVLVAMAPAYGGAQPTKEKSAAPQVQRPAEPAEMAKSVTPEERKAYEQKTAQELEAIQQKIAAIRVQATGGAPQQKRILMRTATRIQMEKAAAENQLTALKKASGAAWPTQKADLDKTLRMLRQELEAAGQRFP